MTSTVAKGGPKTPLLRIQNLLVLLEVCINRPGTCVATPEHKFYASRTYISTLNCLIRGAGNCASRARPCFQRAGIFLATADRIFLILRAVGFVPARLFGERGSCSSKLNQNSGVPECPDFCKFLSGFWTFSRACTAVIPMRAAEQLLAGRSTPFRTVRSGG